MTTVYISAPKSNVEAHVHLYIVRLCIFSYCS